MKLFIAPASGSKARGHLEDTIITPVKFETIKKDLKSKDVYSILSNLGEFGVWGLTFGGTDERFYKTIEKNDIVVFYTSPTISFIGEVVVKERNSHLAEKLWGSVEGETWEFVFFLKTRHVDISVEEFKQKIGYKNKYRAQGFTRVDISEDSLDQILTSLAIVLPIDRLVLGEKYSRKDLTKIFDEDSMGREGIFYCNNFRTIILFSDLVKERTEFTYNNYFEGDYFHWDSQRKQNINTPKIKEIIQKEKEVLLFCRLGKKIKSITQPFIYCGRIEYLNHDPETGNPVHIIFNSLDYEDGHENKDLTNIWERKPENKNTKITMRDPSPRRIKKYVKPDKTERKGLVTSRIGQGYYRELILRRWGRQCSVSHCSIDNVLIASHIVPWIESNKDEKLNVGNGILLSPNLDALFDKHLISFNEKGNILISKKLDKDNLEKLGVTKDMCLQRVFDDMIPFLLRHKSKFIEKEKL